MKFSKKFEKEVERKLVELEKMGFTKDELFLHKRKFYCDKVYETEMRNKYLFIGINIGGACCMAGFMLRRLIWKYSEE